MSGDDFRFEPLGAGDPRRVGRYDLVARIGAGGMGRVFLSFTPGGQPVAVKVIKAEVTQDPRFAERFAQEVRIAQRVNGNNVAQLIDADPHAPEPWLAGAYVAGPSLQELVSSTGPLPAPDALLVAMGTARALQTIHAAGVVHRDLKPANVLLDESGPKVIDFGIVKSLATSMATHGTVTRIGTPAYMSPEQAMGRMVTPASDVFSLGALLYFLATGRPAFEAENPVAMAFKVMQDEPDLSGLDDRLRSIAVPCLAKAPQERPTPARIIELCEQALGTVAPGAYLGIAQARAAIRGRTSALRDIAAARLAPPGAGPAPSPPPGPVPGLAPGPAPGPAFGPVFGPTAAAPPGGRTSPSRNRHGVVLAASALSALLVLGLVLWSPWQSMNNDNASSSGTNTGGSASATGSGDPSGNQNQNVPPPTASGSNAPAGGTPTPTVPDGSRSLSPIQAAQIGDCFQNEGTYNNADLQPGACNALRTFRVLSVLRNTIDLSGCDSLTNDDYNVNYPGYDLVLCMSYQDPYGDAYHAQRGSCVWGASGRNTIWNRTSCQSGTYLVVRRVTGTNDGSVCGGVSGSNSTYQFTTAWTQLDIVLCLKTL